MKNLNKVISIRKSFQGAWVISVERPDSTFTEFQYFGYSKKEAIKMAKRNGSK